jgi:hypothetical protein
MLSLNEALGSAPSTERGRETDRQTDLEIAQISKRNY